MKPLTIEELKALEVGDWVWVIIHGEGHYYQILEPYPNGQSLMIDLNDDFKPLFYDFYGKDWIAYKNKELAEVNENNIPLDIEIQALHMTCFFKEAYIKQLQEELKETRKNK